MMFSLLILSIARICISGVNIEISSVRTYPGSNFVATVCQAGAEKALKANVLKYHPDLRLAYSRPGLVTFKVRDKIEPDFVLKSIFSRAYCATLCQVKSLTEVMAVADEIMSVWSTPLRLHVWGKDSPGPSAEHPDAIIAASDHVVKTFSGLLLSDENKSRWKLSAESEISNKPWLNLADHGDLVFNVIVPTGPHIADPMLVGIHIHSVDHSAFPGGLPQLSLPPDAPSRAYLKIEEALLWSRVRLMEGDTAVEVGSAPGGGTLALLRKGLRVVGVDPSPADRQHAMVVSKHPNFQHIRSRIEAVKRDQLPSKVDWLICDANVSPQSILPTLASLASTLSPHLKGIIINLKLGDENWDRAAETIPELLQMIENMSSGMKVSATQLPSHRHEIVAIGLTKQGLARKSENF